MGVRFLLGCFLRPCSFWGCGRKTWRYWLVTVFTTKVCPRGGKLRGYIRVGGENCGGIWAKNGRKLTIYPRTFILGRISPTLLGSRCSIPPQVSVYWILVPCRGASVWDHADICPPGIYFSSLPRSRTRNHRTRIHFLSYSPLLRANNLHIAQVPVERHTSQRSWVSDTIAIHHKWLPTSLNGASSQH